MHVRSEYRAAREIEIVLASERIVFFFGICENDIVARRRSDIGRQYGNQGNHSGCLGSDGWKYRA